MGSARGRRGHVRGWAALVVLIAGCAPRSPRHDPFLVPAARLGELETVALAPTVLPPGLAPAAPVPARLESLLRVACERAGLTVVPSAEVAAVWERATEQVGGYTDAATGTRDEARYQRVRARALRAMAARWKTDAVILPAVVVVRAEYGSGAARWDGTSERVSRRPLGWLLGDDYRGRMVALSLALGVQDMRGVPLYFNRAGIQLAGKLTNGHPTPVAPEELLADDQRLAAAVDRALAPLAALR